MRKRIANLISKKIFDRSVSSFSPDHDGFLLCHSLALNILEELQDPTDTMILAGINEGEHKPGNWYPAMIQTACNTKIID